MGFGPNCGAPSTATSCTVSNVQSPTQVTGNFIANNLAFAPTPPATTLPTSAAVDSAYLVNVSLSGPDTTVTLAPSNCPNITGSLSNPSSSGSASFSLMFANVSTTCTLTATASNYNPSSSLSVPVYAAPQLGCNGTLGSPPPDPTAPGVVAGARGVSDKDGNSSCPPVNYTFAGDGVNTVALKWDVLSDPNAVFTYTVNTKLRSITDGSGWAVTYRPQVAWLNTDGVRQTR